MPFLVRAQAGTSQSDSREQQLPPEFEVASVKRNSNTPSGRMTFQASAGGRLTVENMPLRLLLQHAYGVRPFQISGGPAWMDSERYDIAAKAGGPVPEKQVVGPMLQALLQNRFGLKLHREMKESPLFNLTQASVGKLRTSKSAGCENALPLASSSGTPPLPCHQVVLWMSPTGVRLRGEQANTGQLAVTLASILGRAVIDQTNFAGTFDLDVEVSLDGLDALMDALGVRSPTTQSPDNTAPSIFTALPQQLGLKLTAGRGPVELLVIDHVERPSEN
ncbi:MAG: TIGR03435 family protein [Candidatus Sulfopaludibacter sp.]|nr:TIGR03435 family protein [Candidatus Sulfopaludibacter sp.]